MQEEPVYRGILGIDIEGFSRGEWTDPVRARLRNRLDRLVRQALAIFEALRIPEADELRPWITTPPPRVS